MENKLVSVITPVYNGEEFIANAIQSVIDQTYSSWELIIVNDGSTDKTEDIILSFNDKRIHYFKQENQGVGAARNLAISKMEGGYLCFLDADDKLTPKSIESRLDVFKSSANISFVDGKVVSINKGNIAATYKPSFNGNPLKALALLSGKCFFGITWMIKIEKDKSYMFRKGLSHTEDLIFYIDICNEDSVYQFTEETIYLRSITENSAMSNIKPLEKGYLFFYDIISHKSILSAKELNLLKNKIRSILVKSYIKAFKPCSALKIGIHRF